MSLTQHYKLLSKHLKNGLSKMEKDSQVYKDIAKIIGKARLSRANWLQRLILKNLLLKY